MAQQFPIIQVLGKNITADEALGSKEKFWFNPEGDWRRWLFKFRRGNTGEHWAEKIAAEVAKWLGVPCSQVELAKFSGRRGSATLSFVNKAAGVNLVHGNEILAGRVLGYNKEKRFRQNDHTLENIIKAIRSICPHGSCDDECQQFAGYLVLDAVTGNTDRHHENWALLQKPEVGEALNHSVAPTFDHASSLGRELLDERRLELLRANKVLRYSLKARGAIYWSPDDKFGMSPLELVKRARQEFPSHFDPWLNKLQHLPSKPLDEAVEAIPPDWMTQVEREFASVLMKENIKSLTVSHQ
jgi:hypothetical protein